MCDAVRKAKNQTPKKKNSDPIYEYTAHNWESYFECDTVTDDGTESFFWRAHTLTVLFCFACILCFVAVKEANHSSPLLNPSELENKEAYNFKRGFLACIGVFLLFGITQTPDGPFKRPHPVVWRFIYCVSILYELLLIFLLFQTPQSARTLLKHIDSELGKPLPEKSYGGNCKIYDPINYPNDPFYNFKDKMDEFVPTHFLGWWFKTLIIRDWWLCMVMSIMFEILEYSLEHQLPNFSECWWDHWILDVLICNGLGIYLGMKTLEYLCMKPYHWRGMWNIPGYRGKLKRAAAQFSPYSWIMFEWKPTQSLKRWLAMLGLILIFLLAETNTFYLKYVLWLKPTHYLNLVRLIFFLLAGGVALRETFQYLDDPRCKKFGRQSWVVGSIIITEMLIIYKFDPDLVTKPFPPRIFWAWCCAIACLCIYTFVKFFVVIHDEDLFLRIPFMTNKLKSCTRSPVGKRICAMILPKTYFCFLSDATFGTNCCPNTNNDYKSNLKANHSNILPFKYGVQTNYNGTFYPISYNPKCLSSSAINLLSSQQEDIIREKRYVRHRTNSQGFTPE